MSKTKKKTAREVFYERRRIARLTSRPNEGDDTVFREYLYYPELAYYRQSLVDAAKEIRHFIEKGYKWDFKSCIQNIIYRQLCGNFWRRMR